jgi:isocitrate dehydrogenase (NAD+)
MNKVNPMAMMLSSVLMLRYLGEENAADRLEHAIAAVIAEGRNVTYDMKQEGAGKAATTTEVAEAVITALKGELNA